MPISKFRTTRFSPKDVPRFYRKSKFLKRNVCNFNVTNQISNGKLYDPITNMVINLNGKNINAVNAPTIIKGDTCTTIYAKITLKNLIKEAANRGELALNPYSRNVANSMGPPPASVITFLKNKVKEST